MSIISILKKWMWKGLIVLVSFFRWTICKPPANFDRHVLNIKSALTTIIANKKPDSSNSMAFWHIKAKSSNFCLACWLEILNNQSIQILYPIAFPTLPNLFVYVERNNNTRQDFIFLFIPSHLPNVIKQMLIKVEFHFAIINKFTVKQQTNFVRQKLKHIYFNYGFYEWFSWKLYYLLFFQPQSFTDLSNPKHVVVYQQQSIV